MPDATRSTMCPSPPHFVGSSVTESLPTVYDYVDDYLAEAMDEMESELQVRTSSQPLVLLSRLRQPCPYFQASWPLSPIANQGCPVSLLSRISTEECVCV